MICLHEELRSPIVYKEGMFDGCVLGVEKEQEELKLYLCGLLLIAGFLTVYDEL